MQVSVDNGFHFLFQSTPSSRRVTHGFKRPINNYWISIHALLTEGDMQVSVDNGFHFLFQSTPSSRRVTHGFKRPINNYWISIHALLTEGDPKRNK